MDDLEWVLRWVDPRTGETQFSCFTNLTVYWQAHDLLLSLNYKILGDTERVWDYGFDSLNNFKLEFKL